ncbi:MAG: hypothetical protein V4801_18360 [Burkholderia gladioli]
MNTLSRSVVIGDTRLVVELQLDRSIARIFFTDGGVPRLPLTISVGPYLKAGLSYQDALDHVVEIARDSVEVAMARSPLTRSCH